MASSQAKKPKGILKKTTNAANSAPAESQSTAVATAAQPNAREIAVQHARIIHQQREVEDQISDSIITLSTFPSSYPSSTSDSSSPTDESSSPASAFKSQVRLYQPGDYDDLVEERNANGLCGYALCPRPRRKVAGGGAFKLLNYGRKDFAIVPRAEYERWCSQGCARRAMYVKVQLNETAAWERAGISSIQIELLEESEERQQQSAADDDDDDDDKNGNGDDVETNVARNMGNMKIEADRKAAKDARDLALERGDTDEKAADRSVDVTIREKVVKMAAEEPSLAKGDEAHLVLDGYKTKFDPKSETISKGTALKPAAEESTPDQ